MKFLFILLLPGFFVNSAIAQYNPNIGSPVISPAPIPYNISNSDCGVTGSTSMQFSIGNTGSAALNNLSQPLIVNISLAKGIPSDTINVANAIGGTFKSRFNWTYNSINNNIKGTQIALIGGPESGNITIDYRVTSTSAAPGGNGMNVNITPPGYTLISNTAGDDNVAISTYTSAPAPRILKFDTLCFSRGQNFSITAMVSNMPCGGWFHWQYKAPCTGGNWVYLNNGLNFIGGHIFNISNAAFSTVSSYPASGDQLAPALIIVDAIPTYTNELDNAQFRVLMTTNGIDPQNTSVANIYGGEEYPDAGNAKTIGLYPAGSSWTCLGCAANQAVSGPAAYDYYGGFEKPVTSQNFFTPVPPTNATNANTDLAEWTGGAPGNNSYKIMNNPDSMKTAYTQIAPRSGNRMLVVNQVNNCSNTRIWYRTITTPVTNPDSPYYFRGNILMRAWFAKLSTTDPDVPLILQVKGAPTRTSNVCALIASVPITVSGNAGCWAQQVLSFTLQGVDTAKYQKLEFSILVSNCTTPVNFALDDICINDPEFSLAFPGISAGTVSGTTPLCNGATAGYTCNGVAGGTWSSSNTAVATVNAATGLVTAVGAGTTDIIYTVSTGCSVPQTASLNLTVNACTPANDDAPGAFVITVGAGCAGSPFTNAGATQSAGEPFAACQGTAGYRTVWYKFVATGANVKISCDYNGGTMGTDSRLALFATTNVNNYASFNSLACDDDNGITATGNRSVLYYTGLLAGNTYYIQVDGKDATTAAGTFCLTVDNMSSSDIATSAACVAGQDLTAVNNNYNGWISLTDANGKLVALVSPAAAGSGISTYHNSININTGAVRTDASTNQKYLDRNYTINNASVSNIKVQFFFLNTELAALQAADPSVTLSNLQATRQTGAVCDNNFIAGNGSNSSIVQTGNGSDAAGFHWVQMTTPGFSKFYLHTKRAYVPVKAWLEGAYNTSLLRHKNITPTWANIMNANALNQPYNFPGFGNYAGTESVAPGFFTSTASTTDVLDWVLLELRDAANPATIMARRAAFIREDGRIVEPDGVSDVSFRTVADGNYFLAIRHRNHLGIRSSGTLSISGNLGAVIPAVYDFSTAQSQAYQNPVITTNGAMADMGNGVFALIGGNANGFSASGNSTVRASGGGNPLINDFLYLVNTTLGGDINNKLTNVYNSADMNMDGTVKANGGTNPAINDQIFLITLVLGGDINKIITQHL